MSRRGAYMLCLPVGILAFWGLYDFAQWIRRLTTSLVGSNFGDGIVYILVSALVICVLKVIGEAIDHYSPHNSGQERDEF